MDRFVLGATQIERAVIAAVADELSNTYKKPLDILTTSQWTADTPLGHGGLDLTTNELEGCARRAAGLFGANVEDLHPQTSDRFSDWRDRLTELTSKQLDHFSFVTVAGDGSLKACHHPADEVFQDAVAAASMLSGRRRFISLVSTHNIFGFELSVLLATLQGSPSIGARAAAPADLQSMLGFGDVLIATPTLWRYLANTLTRIPDNVMGVTFGEPMTSDLVEKLEGIGLGALRELYGATETGLIGWRDAPGDPFRLVDHWKHPPDAEGSGSALIRVRPDGKERRVEAMDRLIWHGDRAFRLSGRRDKAIQVGGVNVFPDRIGEIFEMHPLIEECLVRVGRQREGMNRLIAHLVPIRGVEPDDALMRDIDRWCRSHLRAAERPRIYSFEKSLDGLAAET